MSVCVTTSGFQMSYVPPPGQPTNLLASAASSSQINLTWSAAAAQSGTSIAQYIVHRNDSGNWPPIGSATGTSFSDTALTPLTAYSYYVVAIDSRGAVSAPSNQASAATLGPLPAAPANLVVVSTTSNSVTLDWADATGATSYNLYQNGVKVQTGISSSIVTVSGLSASTSYSFTVTGQNSAGEGPPSNTVNATTQGVVTTALRQNYGFYGCFDYSGGVNASRFTNGDKGIISATAPGDNLTGFSFIITYRSIDKGTSAPSYDFSVIDSYAGACRTAGKQYWIWVNPTAFAASGSSISNGAKCVPDWLLSSAGYKTCMGNYSLGGARAVGAGAYIKWYSSAVFNAFVAMVKALVQRYESDTFCEGIAFCIGTANAIANVVDTLGTKQAQINYDDDYSDAAMITGYKNLFGACRNLSSTLNFWFTTDYLFYQGDSNIANWTGLFDAAIAAKVALGGPDSWTQKWVYPNIPFSPNYPQQDPLNRNNPSFNRGITGDQVFRGWRGGKDYRGKVLYVGCEEATEMGGYVGQFAASDVWLTKGSALDNVQYMMFDVNYLQSGNYGINKAPNTLWTASSTYESTYGPSTYTWIKTAGNTNQKSPY